MPTCKWDTCRLQNYTQLTQLLRVAAGLEHLEHAKVAAYSAQVHSFSLHAQFAALPVVRIIIPK